MAQTKEGAIKSAAQKCGLSVEQYQGLVGEGLKRCTRCKEWVSRGLFQADKSRTDGITATCRPCRLVRYAETYQRAAVG